MHGKRAAGRLGRIANFTETRALSPLGSRERSVMAYVSRLRAGLEPFPGYCLESLVGRGGFSEVWQARSPYGQPVALKFLACGSDTSAAREIRSLQAIRQLQH